MKKRILVLMHYMELGGAESALLGLLRTHDPRRAQMDVFIYDHSGPLMRYIPRNKVKLLPEKKSYSMLERPIVELVKKGFWLLAFARLVGRYKTQKYDKLNQEGLVSAAAFTFQQQSCVRFLPQINSSVIYDLAISFLTPHYILQNKVNAKLKMGWIHTDYSKIFIHKQMEFQMWNGLDYIASISEDVGNSFVNTFPSLESKLLSIENIISADFIRQKADEAVPADMPKKDGVVNLLSVGRFCYPKRFDEVGEIMKSVVNELKRRAEKICPHWYIIGYGSDEEKEKIYSSIRRTKMEQYVTILGKRDNPYPYLKSCDIYVQPSRYEGKSITVREAQILCRPVVVDAYPTAGSQIIDGKDGIILPADLEEMGRGIAGFIVNKGYQLRISNYLREHDYGNEKEIEKIYKLIEA